MEDLKFYQDKMDKTMEVLLADYGTIRAGRANPHVLDKIKVDYISTEFMLGETNIPDRKNYDIAELGLSVEAAKNLYTV